MPRLRTVRVAILGVPKWVSQRLRLLRARLFAKAVAFDSALRKLADTGFVKLLALVGVIIAIWVFYQNMEESKLQRLIQQQTLMALAWQRLDAAKNSPRNEGQREALEALVLYGKRDGRVILRNMELSGMALSGISVSGADIGFSNFSSSHLQGSNLSESYLSESNFSGAFLTEANLSYSDLAFVNFSGTFLQGIDLRGSVLSGAILDNADLRNSARGACGDGGTSVFNPTLANRLRRWYLYNVVYRYSDDCEFWGKTRLDEAYLQVRSMHGAHLEGVDLSRARALTQELVDQACTDDETRLPHGLRPSNTCNNMPKK